MNHYCIAIIEVLSARVRALDMGANEAHVIGVAMLQEFFEQGRIGLDDLNHFRALLNDEMLKYQRAILDHTEKVT